MPDQLQGFTRAMAILRRQYGSRPIYNSQELNKLGLKHPEYSFLFTRIAIQTIQTRRPFSIPTHITPETPAKLGLDNLIKDPTQVNTWKRR